MRKERYGQLSSASCPRTFVKSENAIPLFTMKKDLKPKFQVLFHSIELVEISGVQGGHSLFFSNINT